MPLTAKQRKELNIAILGYLKANDYTSTYDAFLEESKEELSAPAPAALLERKWTALVRLTAKVQQLETQLHATSKQLKSKSMRPLRQAHLHRLELEKKPVARLTGHNKAVNCVRFHPSYPWLATCGDDSKVGVWCHETRKNIKWLRGHTKPVNAIAFNHNGSYLASGSSDMSIKIWNFEDEFRCERTLNGHEHSVTGVEFLKHKENVVASCSRDGTVKLWELDSGYCVQTLADIHDGEWVRRIRISSGGGWMATCSVDKTVRVLAIKKDFKLVALLKGHEHVVEDMAFAPHSANKALMRSEDDDTSSDEESSSSDDDDEADNGDENGDARAERRPKFLASASRDKAILVWDIEREEAMVRLAGHENWVRSLLFVPGGAGRFLVSCADDKTIRVWDLSKRRQVCQLDAAHQGFISGIDWHPSEMLMVSASTDRDVKVWKCKKSLVQGGHL